MANPIIQALSAATGTSNAQTTPQIQQSNNPLARLRSMMNAVRQSPNPNATMQSMMQNDPGMQNVMNYINQNGGDAKTAFYNLAAQRGINPNDILDMLR